MQTCQNALNIKKATLWALTYQYVLIIVMRRSALSQLSEHVSYQAIGGCTYATVFSSKNGGK